MRSDDQWPDSRVLRESLGERRPNGELRLMVLALRKTLKLVANSVKKPKNNHKNGKFFLSKLSEVLGQKQFKPETL